MNSVKIRLTAGILRDIILNPDTDQDKATSQGFLSNQTKDFCDDVLKMLKIIKNNKQTKVISKIIN